MKINKIYFLIWIFIILLGCKNNNDKITIGFVKKSIDHLPLNFAFEIRTLLKEEYQIKKYHSAKLTAKAIRNGNIDIAIIPFSEFCLSELHHNCKIVSFLQREGMGIISKDSINTFSDLEKKKIGIISNPQYFILAKFVLICHEFEADLIEFDSINKMKTSLINGKVDALFLKTPEIFQIDRKYQTIFPFRDAYPYFPTSDVVVSIEFIKNDYELLKQFLCGLKKSCQVLNDNPQIAYEAIFEFYKITQSEGRPALQNTKYIMGLDTKYQKFEENIFLLMKEEGLINSKMHFNNIYDNLENK